MSQLGDASYSIYLSHWFVLSALGKAVASFDLPSADDLPVRAFGVLVSVAIGWLVFIEIEHPIGRLLHRARRVRPALREVPPAARPADCAALPRAAFAREP